ncbi:MAG: alpha/beta hydrolase [Deltaproteobacteria bacterium]|nr:alpha/beta hydrolase [Deltaproteobacteria bacterium]
MLPSVVKRLKQALFVLFGFVMAFFIVWAFIARSMPDLELWHTVELESEFRAKDADSINTFEAYQNLENRLFEELERKVIAGTANTPTNRLSRYNPEGLNNAIRFSHHWNRSYELIPPDIKGSALLLHGLTDSPYSLRKVAQILSLNGFYVLGLRLPVHGTIPAGINSAVVEDWVAAVQIGVRHAIAQKEDTSPFFIVGYSNGAGLAIKYAMDSLEDSRLTVPDRLILFSPAVGITPLAALADWHKFISFIPYFKKFQWTGIHPEYDPYKYNSFPKNAGQQTHNLTVAIRKQINRLKKSNQLSGFPPVLTFQSVVDSTVRTDAIVQGLYAKLDGDQHELVLFDINRQAHTSAFLKSDFQTLIDNLWAAPRQTYRLTLITNRDENSPKIVARVRKADSEEIHLTQLGLTWPESIYSLSHVALPFSQSDPVYGNHKNGHPTHGMNLGALEPRGETGMLRVSVHTLMRLRYNPFFPYMEERIVETVRQQVKVSSERLNKNG